jgi:CHAT domain-containing protein/tetratricopeptide (TPR) repeat protein
VIHRLLLAVVAAVVTLPGVRVAAQVPAQDERVISPFLLIHGTRGMFERADRHERLADAALAAGDHARAARHFAVACYARSEVSLDVKLSSMPCKRASELARAHNIVDTRIHLLMTEGNLRAWSLDVNGAIASLQEALKLGSALDPDAPDSYGLNMAHFTLGAILIEAGQFDFARQELGFARQHCAAAGARVCEGYAHVWMCRLETLLGEFPAAREACEAARPMAALDVFVDMNLGWIRADLEGSLGRKEESLASLQHAWKAAQVKGGEILLPALMHSIADAHLGLGRLDEADAWQLQLERAQASGLLPASYAPQTFLRRGQIDVARGQMREASTNFERATASPMHEMAIDAHYLLAQARRQLGDLPGARQSLEKAIARIEGGRTSVAGTAVRASYLDLHARTYRELIDVRWTAEGDASAPAILEIAEAGRARALLDQLASAHVPGAAAPTLTASAVQATLGPDDVLVEYVSSANRLLAVTVTRDRIGVTPLPGAGTAAALAQRVEFFSAAVQERDEAGLRPSAARLYQDLLAPALVSVPSTATTLIIAADGPLHRLPFDAIGDGQLVIDRWNVVTLPSASALAKRATNRPASRAALVVAAPTVNSMAALPAAPREAAALRRRVGGEIRELTGDGASEAGLQGQDPGEFAVLHFASHAVVDEARPLRSALMLTPGQGSDGRWSAEEIYRAKLNADLVVLSACSTAAGAESAGEGVMSLSRAFLYAGAGATIATLWDVPDAPAPIFTDVLYRELGNGQPLGVAAAEARRELRRRGAPPRAWAAYVLSGAPSARVHVVPRTPTNVVAARIAGIAALVLLAIVMSRKAAEGRRAPMPFTG